MQQDSPSPRSYRENPGVPDRLYLSGPMTGLPGCNRQAFNEAAEVLRSKGCHVFNPGEHDGGSTDKPREFYMKFDIRALVELPHICFLPGWEYSRGALVEAIVGWEIGCDYWVYAPEAEHGVLPLDRESVSAILERVFHVPPRPTAETGRYSPNTLYINNAQLQDLKTFAVPGPDVCVIKDEDVKGDGVTIKDPTINPLQGETAAIKDPLLNLINESHEEHRSGSDGFVSVLVEMYNLHQKKGHDYGKDDDEYENVRAGTAMFKDAEDWQFASAEVRSKGVRVKNFIQKGQLRNERVRDALIDQATYSVIAVALYDEDHPDLKGRHL